MLERGERIGGTGQRSWLAQIVGARRGNVADRIAQGIVDAIASGQLKAGERLPTHRSLAAELGIAVRTVTRGYARAEHQGCIVATVGRGTFVQGTLSERFADPQGLLFDLTVNAPPYDFLGDELREMIGQVLAERPEIATYQPPGGTLRHRAAGQALIARRGFHPECDRVFTCSGGHHGLLTSILHGCGVGSTIAVEHLTYPAIRTMADALRLRLVPVEHDADGMLPGSLEEVLGAYKPSAVIVTTSGHNPTAATLSGDRRLEIARHCARTRTMVIEDDVCGLLTGGPAPVASLLPSLTYYVTSTSKLVGPGFGAGLVVCPSGATQGLASALHGTSLSHSGLSAELMTQFVARGRLDGLVHAHREEAAARFGVFSRAFRAKQIANRAYRSSPGIYVSWLELPEPWSANDFVRALRHRGLLVAPGGAFAVGREPDKQCIRLCTGAGLTLRQAVSASHVVTDVLAAGLGSMDANCFF